MTVATGSAAATGAAKRGRSSGMGLRNRPRHVTAIRHVATRARIAYAIGLSNANRNAMSANIPFLSRVVSRVGHRNLFSLSVGYANSAFVSSRRDMRSANVALNRTFGGTLNSGGNVHHCKRFCTPLSRTLAHTIISLSNHPNLRVSVPFAHSRINGFSISLFDRFFCNFIGRS